MNLLFLPSSSLPCKRGTRGSLKAGRRRCYVGWATKSFARGLVKITFSRHASSPFTNQMIHRAACFCILANMASQIQAAVAADAYKSFEIAATESSTTCRKRNLHSWVGLWGVGPVVFNMPFWHQKINRKFYFTTSQPSPLPSNPTCSQTETISGLLARAPLARSPMAQPLLCTMKTHSHPQRLLLPSTNRTADELS